MSNTATLPEAGTKEAAQTEPILNMVQTACRWNIAGDQNGPRFKTANEFVQDFQRCLVVGLGAGTPDHLRSGLEAQAELVTPVPQSFINMGSYAEHLNITLPKYALVTITDPSKVRVFAATGDGLQIVLASGRTYAVTFGTK